MCAAILVIVGCYLFFFSHKGKDMWYVEALKLNLSHKIWHHILLLLQY